MLRLYDNSTNTIRATAIALPESTHTQSRLMVTYSIGASSYHAYCIREKREVTVLSIHKNNSPIDVSDVSIEVLEAIKYIANQA